MPRAKVNRATCRARRVSCGCDSLASYVLAQVPAHHMPSKSRTAAKELNGRSSHLYDRQGRSLHVNFFFQPGIFGAKRCMVATFGRQCLARQLGFFRVLAVRYPPRPEAHIRFKT
jgi:hypothetical protein